MVINGASHATDENRQRGKSLSWCNAARQYKKLPSAPSWGHHQLPTRQSAVLFAKMKWATVATALLPLAAGHGFTHQEYASGEVMELMMNGKEVCANCSKSTAAQSLTVTGRMGEISCSWRV